MPKCVLAVLDGERRGKARIDHRGPFRAIDQRVKVGHFPCAKPDLDLPSQKKFRSPLTRQDKTGLSKRPKGPERQRPRTEMRGIPGNTGRKCRARTCDQQIKSSSQVNPLVEREGILT